ncbi:hypothetical protein AWZ03_009860, partial [Drosophila navojoa]
CALSRPQMTSSSRLHEFSSSKRSKRTLYCQWSSSSRISHISRSSSSSRSAATLVRVGVLRARLTIASIDCATHSVCPTWSSSTSH